MVRLSLTPLNFLALQSAKFPSPHPHPRDGRKGFSQTIQDLENVKSRSGLGLINWACACGCSCYPQFPFPPTLFYGPSGSSERL